MVKKAHYTYSFQIDTRQGYITRPTKRDGIQYHGSDPYRKCTQSILAETKLRVDSSPQN